ncbi:purine nucleoside permease [Phenylobacterium sp. LjRoot225]|uniref:purine nucleoside permease n=1 Tax=Phenylobacterium sp. LjRoot225 TaxID=3342285 RepID=UPI003ECE38D1
MRLTPILLACLAFVLPSQLTAAPAPWTPKVVIITTFENGKDTGDKPGELQLWIEREHLTETIAFPGGVHPLMSNADHSVVAILTGMSLVNAGPSIMALGADPRFDLRRSYWLVAGIAGVDPAEGAIGSAAWAKYVVNDVAQSIDMREAPADWPYGVYVNGADRPNVLPSSAQGYGPDGEYPLVFPLNPALADWALALTRDVELQYTPEMADYAKKWTGFPKAQARPQVFQGESFAADHYWHGRYMNQYARDWVKMLTAGKGRFAMSNMEDSAIASAMVRLDRMGKADGKRFMVLRTASNYTVAHEGQSALESVTAPYPGGGIPAYEAAYRVGSKVVRALVSGWGTYRDRTPEGEWRTVRRRVGRG